MGIGYCIKETIGTNAESKYHSCLVLMAILIKHVRLIKRTHSLVIDTHGDGSHITNATFRKSSMGE